MFSALCNLDQAVKVFYTNTSKYSHTSANPCFFILKFGFFASCASLGVSFYSAFLLFCELQAFSHPIHLKRSTPFPMCYHTAGIARFSRFAPFLSVHAIPLAAQKSGDNWVVVCSFLNCTDFFLTRLAYFLCSRSWY